MKKITKVSQNSQILIVLWGILMHIFLILGVLDANFHSPIIPGLPVIPMPKGSPAKRVYIFVADGLRYRTFKNDIPPYLNSVIKEHGVHGISHTRVPTESRPGNIAIVAGLYEDPSALFTGWKRNSVDFDNIFNQSEVSWLWGSPDIIPLFTKSDKHNIHGSSYPAHWQDFSKESNFMRLDNWVFEQYSNWLESSGTIEYKTADKMIIYFHLLSCDTIGHAAKPQSREYVQTMENVDDIIKKVVEITEEKFEKNSTSYILTADHGMTDWGSHGSGSTDETETPFVAWGAGVGKNERFFNIEQADITPLVSALAGISVPTNNEGTLPYEVLDPKYRDFTARAFLSNAKQLAEQVKANRLLAVGDAADKIYSKDREFNEMLKNCEELLKDKNYDEFFTEIKNAAALAKESLSYYRRYQTNTYLYCLFFMWAGWIVLLFVESSGKVQTERSSWTIVPNAVLAIVIVYFVVKYAVAGFKEFRLLGYGLIMAVSFWLAIRGMINKIPSLRINSCASLVECTGVLILVFMMFLGLIYRESLTATMLLTVGLQKLMFNRNVSLNLLISGVILSVFPLLPVDKSRPRTYIVLFALVVSAVFLIRNKKIYNYNKVFELLRILLTSFMYLNVVDGRSWLSWFILVTTPISISLYPKDIKLRLFGVTAALLSPLALLSASYEPLFFIIFSWNLQQWPIYDYPQRSTATQKTLSPRDFSVAAFLMVYTLLSFFGTGNMASISSFDPTWTRHFRTVFSPFTMKALILFKIATPLILVGFLIRALEKQTNSTMFSAILLLGDCLAIPLMFKVTNQGSWLDIGSSISRLVIAIGLPMILLVVYYLNNKLFTVSLQELTRLRSLKSQRLRV